MIQDVRNYVIGGDAFGFGFKREQDSMTEHIVRYSLNIFG